MSALENKKINSLARILRNESNVEFKHNGFFYEIFKSADTGFVVNLYSSDDKDDEDEFVEANLVDGGLYNGTSEVDAIKFML